ncbi:hypothetical protein [Shinella zoogloeoides]|uniref:Lipoprotein n=1 Tax=Shinella zoogloeoides TaxID=352475 RepID=A0A6N8TGE9_SHIZO|nr:hypothetical protein [Shinella zoogloeoides]MXO01505.1 hypothetical protein [Shinella zoogloeoides]UEX80253.1 hypothetical protein K8M09_11520 [Shinella zoogloeoides]
MQELMKRLALIGLIVTLTGCNSTDALIPPAEVGGGFNSPPVTQSDLDQMSADTSPVTTMPVATATQQTAFTSSGSSTGADTAGTLQGQADALARNNGAGSAAEADAELARTTAERSLAAEEVASLPAANAGSETIRFLPIIGAPVEAVTPLSKRLGAEARSGGLTIRSASDTSARYILKGYFSAMNDNGKTTVVYVWDVLDGSGARLHRIQGQETVSGTAADPWTVVPAQTMEGIAQKTIRQYLDWRGSLPG